MQLKQIACVFLIVEGLAGCSAHNPFILMSTTDVTHVGTTKYPPHNNRVFVTWASLPTTAKYEVLGILDVGRVTYGTSSMALQSLADAARKLGADAVVETKTWFQPSGWSWYSPHGSGKAVKITEPASVDLPSLGGNWK